MGDSNVPITAGSGTNIDTFTQASGDHRQAVVIGDAAAPQTAAVTAAGGLAIQGVQSAVTSLSVTTSTSATGTLAVTGYSVATVTITGTHSGINLTFEVSQDGGTTWVPITGVQLDAFVTTTNGATGVITTNASRGWDITLGAVDSFRVRATAFGSGTGAVKVAFDTIPYEAAPSVGIIGTVPVSGTVTATASGTYTTTPTTPTASIISSTATTNTAFIKNAAGTVFSITASNTGAAAAFVKFFNKASAPTLGTDVPAITISVPASGTVNVPFGTQGMRFGTGIAIAITNLAADSDATAVALAQVKVLTAYI